MSTPMQELLLGYLLGALDDAEQELVETRLQFDPQWREELGRLRERLARLDAAYMQYEPPAGLAQRTCDRIFGRPAARARQAALTPAGAAPAGGSRFRAFDVTAAACIAVAALLLVLPAINTSRFNSQVTTCQDNLRELGGGLATYSEQNGGYFPRVPTRGKLAFAGVYAPTLAQHGLLHETRKVICPASPQAEEADFHLPSLAELEQLPHEELDRLLPVVGGSYGYSLGHVEDGRYRDVKNEGRASFALMSDAPDPLSPEGLGRNHGGQGENVLFEDGHVQFVTTSRPTGLDDIFSNDDGDIAAGLHRHDSVIVPSATSPNIFQK